MKFVDEVLIAVESGAGGAGAVSFRREKFVPRGGPDGGDGGKGGSVILRGSTSVHTLVDLQLRPILKAQSGEAGSGRNKVGRSGNDLVVPVPFGTQIEIISSYDPSEGTKALKKQALKKQAVTSHTPESRASSDLDSDSLESQVKNSNIRDITPDSPEIIIARGGRGGKGNAFFKSPTRQTPDFAQPGEVGEAFKVRLTLKLMADVGLLGFPNAGKSSLLRTISAAKPMVGSYPFTTLTPSLGVVRLQEGSHYVVADIPGIIEGAHAGKGLGLQFLKHLERTRLLVHLIDPTVVDQDKIDPASIVAAYKTINQELAQFSERLTKLPQIIVISKADLVTDEDSRQAIRECFDEILFVSSATGEGIKELTQRCGQLLAEQLDIRDHCIT